MIDFIQRISNRYREAFSGLPREVWWLAIVMLINRSGTMVLPFLALYANSELGFSAEFAAMLLGIYGVGSLIGNYLGGLAIRPVGAIRVQTVSIFLTGFWFLVLSTVTNQIEFVAILLLLSISAEMFRPANSTAIANFSSPEQRNRAMGLNRLAMHLGYSVGPAIGGVLAQYNYLLLFWIDGLTCVLSALVMLIYFSTCMAAEKSVTRQSKSKDGFKSPWSDKIFLVFMALTFTTSLVGFQLMSTFPLYLVEHYQFAEWQIGILMAVKTAAIVLFEMVLLKSIESRNLLQTIACGGFLVCLGFGLLPFGIGFGYAMGCVLIWTAGEMLSMPTSFTWIAQRTEPENRGSYMGVLGMSYSAAFIAGPILGSELYGVNPDYVWYASLTIGFVVLLGFLLLSKSVSAAE